MGTPQSPFSTRLAAGPALRPGSLPVRPGGPPAAAAASQAALGGRPALPGAITSSQTAPCIGVPSLHIGCARLTGVVGPLSGTQPGPPANNYADVLLVQQLINVVVECGYVDSSVLGGGNGKLATPLILNGQWSPALFNAIRQIEVLYFHGRANPHGIGVIDPQADESLFVFLVGLANGSQKAKQQLSVQMKALADKMVPAGKVLIDVGGTAPDGTHVPQKVTAIEHWLPILLDALTKFNLTDTDMVMMAIACARTETTRFIPINEPLYDLNTTGSYTDSKTGQVTWTSTTDEVHSNYAELAHHHFLQSSRGGHQEKWAENPQGDKGDIYQTNPELGNTQPGDGWKYRGRGLIQLTGRALYADACVKVGVGNLFLTDPDQVNSEKWAGLVVAGYLKSGEAKIRRHLAKHDLKAARMAVNGGKNGLPEFVQSWNAGSQLIAMAVIEEAKAQVRQHRRRHVKKKV